MTKAATSHVEDRWNARPVLAAIVRGVAFLVPIAMSTAFAMIVTAALPSPSSRATQITMWLVVAVASTGVLIVTDVAARRILPLAALLNLSIVFPDEAPSRYKIARRAGGVRSLEARLEQARRLGVTDEPSRAAGLILELVTALQRHDRKTRGHSERVHLFTEMLAQELKLPDGDRDRLRWAALVHDVGKLTVAEDVLNKPAKPDPDEWEQLRRHPNEGAKLCEALRAWMGDWWLAIEQHHEHYDGNGYPRGLAGSQISLGARIVSVADAFEVMTAARSYKHAQTAAAGREELSRCAGTQFDPAIVRAFLNISLGRLRLALGPLAWLAQFPALESVIRAGGLLRLAGGLLTAGTLAVLIGAPTHATPTPAASAGETVADLADHATPPAREPRVFVTTDEPVLSVPILIPQADPFTPASDLPDTAAPEPNPTPPAPVWPTPANPVPPFEPPEGPPVPQPPAETPQPPDEPTPQPTDGPTPSDPVATPPPAPPQTPPTAVADATTMAEDTVATIDVLANDTDADGDALAVTSVTAGGAGATVLNGDDTIDYTPDPEANGIDSFTYDVTDGAATVTATVTVTVTAVNDAPSFTPGADQSIAEDAGPQTVTNWATAMTPGPANEASQTTSFNVVADDPALFVAGPAVDPATGDLTYTPADDANGTSTITVVLRDNGGTADGGVDASAPATFDVVISPVNDPPTAFDDTAATQEDTAVVIDVLANDTDVDGDVLSVASYDAAGITDGALVDLGGGSFRFTPDPDFFGTQTFDYVAADPSGATASATATITVVPQPDDPIAADDSYSVAVLAVLTIPAPGVLANDNDPDDDPLTITANTDPALGLLTLNPDGSFTYIGVVLGDQTFTYTVSDGTGRSDTATVTISVQAAPVTTSTFYLGTSGSDPDNYALEDAAPPAGDPEPDHDSDGNPGLHINNSSGNEDDTDPTKYQHWTRTYSAPTTYSGEVRLALWSTPENFDDSDDGHYHIYLHDCASDGTDCNLLLETDSHIDDWNGGVADWTFRELSLGSIDHTFAVGRMLRVRLMFGHNAMWVAMSQDRPTRIILSD